MSRKLSLAQIEALDLLNHEGAYVHTDGAGLLCIFDQGCQKRVWSSTMNRLLNLKLVEIYNPIPGRDLLYIRITDTGREMIQRVMCSWCGQRIKTGEHIGIDGASIFHKRCLDEKTKAKDASYEEAEQAREDYYRWCYDHPTFEE